MKSFIKVYQKKLDQKVCSKLVTAFDECEEGNGSTNELCETKLITNNTNKGLSQFDGELYKLVTSSLEEYLTKHSTLFGPLDNNSLELRDSGYWIVKWKKGTDPKFEGRLISDYLSEDRTMNRVAVICIGLNRCGKSQEVEYPHLGEKFKVGLGDMLIAPVGLIYQYKWVLPKVEDRYHLMTYITVHPK